MENNHIKIIKINDEDIRPQIQIEKEEKIEYRDLKKIRKNKHQKKRILQLLIVVILIVAYFISSFSNVKTIIVKNAKLVTDEEVLTILNINKQSKYLTVNNLFKKKLDNPLIKDYSIQNNYLGEIIIDIQETKLLGYMIFEEEIVFINENGDQIKNKALPDYVMQLPKINVYDEVVLQKLTEKLKNLDNNIISRISEINPYSVSYDSNMVILLMEDGNKVYSSMNDLQLLENYNNILEKITDKYQCIQLDDTTNSAFKFKCP